MKEIEYKFLVDFIPQTKNKIKISQYYVQDENVFKQVVKILGINDEQAKTIDTVRVRESSFENTTKYYLTAKTKGDFVRNEYEREISKDLALDFIKHSSKMIKKIRSVIKIDDLKFEFDDYFERTDNLKVCEIEVKNQENYEDILNIFKNILKIDAKDVTYIQKYKNCNLARSDKDERNI